MKRDFPLNVSRPTYGATAPSSVAAPALTTGLVAQPMGRRTSSRGAQSGLRGQTAGAKTSQGLFAESSRCIGIEYSFDRYINYLL